MQFVEWIRRRAIARFARTLTLTLLVALTCGAGAAHAATQLFPDLKTLPPRDLRYDTTDVSADSSGVIHHVLRFSNTVWNAGEGTLLVHGTIDPATGSGTAYQTVKDSAGGSTDYPVGNFYYHAVHHHYHFDNWGRYELWTKAAYDAWIASGRQQGQYKVLGTKTTSCVLDEEFVKKLANTTAYGQFPFAGCSPNAQNQLSEGLSPGWGDTYDYYRFEQWVDLGSSDLPDGQYVLRSATDPLNKIYESAGKSDPAREGDADNEAITPFSVQGGKLVDTSPPTGTVQINDVDQQTSSPKVTVKAFGRDDVSAIDQVRLSNDGTTWATYAYTGASDPQSIPWDLTDSRYGGNTAGGVKSVYAQFHDTSGKWSNPSVTDTIRLTTCGTGTGSTSRYAAAVAADTPVSWWRLAETCGSAAADEQKLNPGTYANGPGLGATGLVAADPGNTAVSFNGTSQYMRVPGSSSLNLTSPLSLEAWIKPAALPAAGSFASVLSKAESYSIQFNGPRLEFTVIQAGVRRRLQAPAGAVQVGTKYQVAATYDGTTQRLYLNGALVASQPLTGPASVTSSPVVVGSWSGGGELFSGTIDEPAVYNRALSAAQVKGHYDAGMPAAAVAPPSNLVATAASTSQINLTWADDASNETGQVLERSTNPGFTATTTVNLPAHVTSYSDTGLTPGTTYWYRLKAVTATDFSTYSNTATAQTQTATPPPPPPPASASYASTVLADGPVSYWHLGEAPGAKVAADAVGANPGTYEYTPILGDASLLPGATTDTAARFSGTNDHVRVPDSNSLDLTSAFSLEAWIRPNTLPTSGNFASVISKPEAYSIQFNGPRLEFTVIQSGTRQRLQAPAGAVVAGSAYHVVATFDGATQRLYLNGALVASRAQTGAASVNSNDLNLASWDGGWEYLNGTIDEAAVYAKTLSAAQVQSHWSVGSTVPAATAAVLKAANVRLGAARAAADRRANARRRSYHGPDRGNHLRRGHSRRHRHGHRPRRHAHRHRARLHHAG